MLTTCKMCLDFSDMTYIDTKYNLEACHPCTICPPNHLQRWLHNGVMLYHTKQQKMGLHSPTLQNDCKIVTNFNLGSFTFNIVTYVKILQF